jgi:hypothetical protein
MLYILEYALLMLSDKGYLGEGEGETVLIGGDQLHMVPGHGGDLSDDPNSDQRGDHFDLLARDLELGEPRGERSCPSCPPMAMCVAPTRDPYRDRTSEIHGDGRGVGYDDRQIARSMLDYARDGTPERRHHHQVTSGHRIERHILETAGSCRQVGRILFGLFCVETQLVLELSRDVVLIFHADLPAGGNSPYSMNMMGRSLGGIAW